MTTTLKYPALNEKIVIGSMLRHETVRRRLIRELLPSDFYVDKHRTIFIALQTITNNGLDYTPGTLMSMLQTGDWGGKEYLDELENLGKGNNIDYHIERMRWDIIRLECFRDSLPEIIAEIKDPNSDPNDVVRLCSRMLERLGESKTNSSIECGETLAASYSASIRARQVQPQFRASGYMVMDQLLGEGFAAKRMSVIAGTPSTGKTTMMLNLAQRQSKRWKVGILAWEGGKQSAIDGIVSSQLGISYDKFSKFTHMLTTEEQSQIDDYVANLLGSDHISFLRPPPTRLTKGSPWDVNDKILDWVEAEFSKWNRDIIYWDLFLKRLMALSPDQVTNALNRVQQMQTDGNDIMSHICLLHQINLKDVERRKDQRPTRDALKGTGAWIEVPDLIFGLHRPALYQSGVKDNIIEVTCFKQRRGRWPWKIIFDWDGDHVAVSGGRVGKITVVNTEETFADRRRI